MRIAHFLSKYCAERLTLERSILTSTPKGQGLILNIG